MFDIAFKRVFNNEGGYQNDYNDRGNWTSGVVGKGERKGTKYGISAMTYPHLDIKNLTLAQAKEIYRVDWWEKLNLDKLPQVLQYQGFDAAINHGMGNATKIVQRAVGVKDDGIIGPKTKQAVLAMDSNDLVLNFLAERLLFMTRLTKWADYGKGWAVRIAHNLKYASEDN